MKTSADPRHRHRFKLVQLLYSSYYQKTPSAHVLPIWSNLKTIDPLIAESAPEWPLDKLNPVDLAILRLAVYELVIDKQTPYRVIIDEAVELAKELGSSTSPGFINGALGNLVTKYAIEPKDSHS